MKITSRIIAMFIVVTTFILSTVTTAVSAEQSDIYSWSSYDIKNYDYINFVNKMTISPSEEKLLTLMQSDYPYTGLCHVYEKQLLGTQYPISISKDVKWYTTAVQYVREYDVVDNNTGKSGRMLSDITYYLSMLYYKYDSFMEKPSVEDIDAFLAENNYMAKIDDVFDDGTRTVYYHLEYDESLGYDDKIDVLYAINNKFGLSTTGFVPLSNNTFFPAPDLSLTSAVKLQRYLSHSAELDNSELTDFDLNGDGDLNVIDLIMMKRKLTDMNK